MQIKQFWFLQDQPLCDGTPRKEKGYRKVVEVMHNGVKLYAKSPLAKSQKELLTWWPSYKQVSMLTCM